MMPRQRERQNISSSVTNDFKMGVVALVFFVTCFHLMDVIYDPDISIVPSEMLLASVLFAMVYLWAQEVRDRRRLEEFNTRLLITQDEMRKSQFETISALVASQEAKTPHLSGHSRRVTQYALSMADKMDLSEEEKRKIECAGYLHDIGKMGIEEKMLYKEEEELNEEEKRIMKKHPILALEILEPLKFMKDEKLIIRHHHERYDGTGYPDGLEGKNIPLGARIIGITDNFDIMNSKRPHREALSKDKIIEEIKSSSGLKYDPDLVDIFLDMVRYREGIFVK